MMKAGFMNSFTRAIDAVGRLFAAAGKNWAGDNMPSMSASLAYHALLSMAPFLLVLVAIFRLVLSDSAVELQILANIEQSLGPEMTESMRIVLQNAVAQRSNAIFVGGGTILMLLVFSAGFFRQLIHALNVVWKVHEVNAGIISSIVRLIRGHFLAFAMVICIAVFLYASALFKAVAIIPEQALLRAMPSAAGFLTQLPRYIVPAALFLLFMLLFWILPARRISLRDVWPGSLLTTILFVACYRLIRYYLSHTAVASYYGAAGSFIVILLWIYWSAMILLFGAEFARVYAMRYGSLRRR